MTKILFHILKGKNGWSALHKKKIDVSKVIEMSCRERLFKIFDNDYPFVLTIDYADENKTVIPITANGSTFFIPHTEETQTITKRYKTSKEVYDEISEIIKKKDELRRETNMDSKK